MIDREFLHNKYYTALKHKGFPDKWLSGALWMNSQYDTMAKNFKQAGIDHYTFEELQNAVAIGWEEYKNSLSHE